MEALQGVSGEEAMRNVIGPIETDPVKARAAALESLDDRMPNRPDLVDLAMLARDWAVAANGSSRAVIPSIKMETKYLDTKYGYGIRPWLPLLWAGWRPAEVPCDE